MVTIKLKDGSQRQYPKGTTLLQVAEDISKKLAQNAVVARFNGQISDLNTEITEDGTLELLDFTDPEAMDVYRHSSSHVMAQAVQRLWPGTQLAIGPAIDKGFYYDLDSEHTFTPEDFQAIEAEMQKIVKADIRLSKELSREEPSFIKKNEPIRWN